MLSPDQGRCARLDAEGLKSGPTSHRCTPATRLRMRDGRCDRIHLLEIGDSPRRRAIDQTLDHEGAAVPFAAAALVPVEPAVVVGAIAVVPLEAGAVVVLAAAVVVVVADAAVVVVVALPQPATANAATARTSTTAKATYTLRFESMDRPFKRSRTLGTVPSLICPPDHLPVLKEQSAPRARGLSSARSPSRTGRCGRFPPCLWTGRLPVAAAARHRLTAGRH